MTLEDTVVAKWAGEIIGGLIVLLLGMLKIVGQRAQQQATKAMQSASINATHTDLMECQQEVIKTLRSEFHALRREFREELRVEIRGVQSRLDAHIDGHSHD